MGLTWLYEAVTGFPNGKPAPWEKKIHSTHFYKNNPKSALLQTKCVDPQEAAAGREVRQGFVF